MSAPWTASGLTVRSEIDANAYPKGMVVSDADFAAIKIAPIRSMVSGTTPYIPIEVFTLFVNGP
jgi:hypothetical protein